MKNSGALGSTCYVCKFKEGVSVTNLLFSDQYFLLVICKEHCLLPEDDLRIETCRSKERCLLPDGDLRIKTCRSVVRGKLSYLAPLGSENISAPYFK